MAERHRTAGTRGTADRDDVEARRLRMRSWRRGMREMDLILGPFADAEVAAMDGPGRVAYQELLEENDQDLYAWVSGGQAVPECYRGLMARIRAFHGLGGPG